MAERRATMRDVARASGVSPTTVSFVLNDAVDQTISPDTRARVLAAAAALDYRPHAIARALREGSSRLVVLHVGELPRAPMLEAFIGGLDAELAAAGHGLLVSFAGAGSSAVEAVHPRAIIDLPGMYARQEGAADGGWIDGMASHLHTQMAYLREAGHRAVAIAAPSATGPFETKIIDFGRAAARLLGMPEPALLCVGEDGALRDALLALPPAVTAVAALTDTLAFATLAALTDAGIAVPDRIAVIGLGDVPEAALWRPPLTSVRVDTRSYGRRLARQVLGLPVGDATPAPTRIVHRATA